MTVEDIVVYTDLVPRPSKQVYIELDVMSSDSQRSSCATVPYYVIGLQCTC